MLVDGKWSGDWHPIQSKDQKGGFVRQDAQFRGVVTPHGEGGFKAEAGRYHLYVALICPWASRTLVARKLKGLEAAISVSVVEPELGAEGWRFAAGADAVNGARFMHEIYTNADPRHTGRATVPVLWDRRTGRIVNNESSDILRMFNTGFGRLANDLDLYPEHLRAGIDALNAQVYAKLNNGVYRCGFASTQLAYEDAYHGVFEMLDALEQRLAGGGPCLFGDVLTEADIRLFVTLVRFDAAYHGLFKANKRRILDYPALSGYLARLLAIPAFRDTVNIAHIKRGYYSVTSLNPTGIVPLGPDGIDLQATGL